MNSRFTKTIFQPVLLLLIGSTAAPGMETNERFSKEKLLYRNAISTPEITVPADLDGDGDLDIVARGNKNGARSIVWFENTDGSGGFSAARILHEPKSSGDLHVVDLDGDGDLDIVSGELNPGSQIIWLEQLDGAGGFAEAERLARGRAMVFPPDDLDNDG